MKSQAINGNLPSRDDRKMFKELAASRERYAHKVRAVYAKAMMAAKNAQEKIEWKIRRDAQIPALEVAGNIQKYCFDHVAAPDKMQAAMTLAVLDAAERAYVSFSYLAQVQVLPPEYIDAMVGTFAEILKSNSEAAKVAMEAADATKN